MSCQFTIFDDESISLQQKCYQASQCSDVQQFVNIFEIVYCKLDGSYGYYLFVFFPGIIILFRLMSLVIEQYLAPSVEFITETLKISQQLSAVTLLALANGAGDVITAIVASENLEGVSLNIGSLYGAGFFVSTLVVGVTIINSKGFIQMKVSFILRDILFYIIATLVVIFYGIKSEFSTIDSILLLALYCVLIIIVAIQESTNQKQLGSEEKRISIDPLIPSLEETQEDIKASQEIIEEESLADKIFCIIDIPFKWILKICIPPTPSNYSKTLLVISILPSLTFIYFILVENTSNPYKYLNVLSLSILLGTIIYSTSQNNEIPKYYVAVQFYVVMVSLVWIYLLSGILIDALTFFGMLSNLAPSYLGMTVIAMGNALPDGLVTMTLAKQGYATMAMTGAYLGQVFGLLVGLGLSLLKTNIRTGYPVSFDLFNKDLISENIIMLIVIFSTLGVLIITFIYGIMKKYRFGRDLSLVLIFIYAVIFCTVTTIALKNIV